MVGCSFESGGGADIDWLSRRGNLRLAIAALKNLIQFFISHAVSATAFRAIHKYPSFIRIHSEMSDTIRMKSREGKRSD